MNQLTVYDNTIKNTPPEVVLLIRGNQVQYIASQVPGWLEEGLEKTNLSVDTLRQADESRNPLRDILSQAQDSEQTSGLPVPQARLQQVFPNEYPDFVFRHETGDIQTFQHRQTQGHVHIDAIGNFHDRYANPINPEAARETALGPEKGKTQAQDDGGHGFSLSR